MLSEGLSCISRVQYFGSPSLHGLLRRAWLRFSWPFYGIFSTPRFLKATARACQNAPTRTLTGLLQHEYGEWRDLGVSYLFFPHFDSSRFTFLGHLYNIWHLAMVLGGYTLRHRLPTDYYLIPGHLDVPKHDIYAWRCHHARYSYRRYSNPHISWLLPRKSPHFSHYCCNLIHLRQEKSK